MQGLLEHPTRERVDGVVEAVAARTVDHVVAGGPDPWYLLSRVHERIWQPALVRALTAQSRADALRLSASMIPVDSATRLIDLRCRTGVSTLELARRIAPDGGLVVGLDARLGLLRTAERNRQHARANHVVFLHAPTMRLPFRSQGFDVVHLATGLSDAEHPDLWLDAVLQLLRPGGTLVLSTYVQASRFLVRRVQERISRRFEVRWLSPPTLKDLLEERGFALREEVLEGAGMTLRAELVSA